MARLLDLRTDAVTWLHAKHRLGRHGDNHVVVADPRVSGSHAELRWTATGWEVRDLGSRNGTYVDGQRLESGGSAALKVGQRLALGGESPVVEVVDTAPPTALAVRGAQVVQALGGVLSLGNDDAPVSVYLDGSGQWILDEPAGEAPIEDGATVVVASEAWTLHLPDSLESTRESTVEAARRLALHFRVSQDEEYVEMDVELDGAVHRCTPRAHHYLLLTLARRRVADAEAGEPLESAHGWTDQTRLARDLRLSASGLKVAIHRARIELAELGVPDAASLVERRRSAGQVRLGVSVAGIASI